ncbi:MAG: 2'-5' RNA ligase family protein [Anaerolineae bacterium]|nr:2'-5' RNA ligase family protein [Anaerolineae bacterium]
MTDNLLELEVKAADPSRLSVQSRADDSLFAPTSDVNGNGGLFWLTMGSALDEEPQWNAIYPNWRDRYLLNFSRSEGMLASAIYSMKSRIGTLDYTVNGPPRAKKFAQDLLKSPGLGEGLRSTVQKLSGDLNSSDNGAFIELWRPGKPDSDAGDRPVLGFAHLDSRQCWRSFDPEFPVWYTHPVTAQIRKLHRSRVVMDSNNPQSVELARGIGFCAVSRILLMSRTFRSMQIFLNEKVSGRFTRAIGAVNGLTASQFRKALQANDAESDARGFQVYKDIPFFFNPSGQANDEIKIFLQDLASIPDGFVFRDDADLYAYILAFAFGVDAREFWPASQSGATKADASVQNMKAQGRGIGDQIQTITGMLRKCLPATVEFEFDYTDDDQDLLAAQINQARATTYDMMVKNGSISAQESRAMSIAVGILDQTVLDTMVAPATSDSNPDMPPATPALPDGKPDDAAQPVTKAGHTGVMAALYLPKMAADLLYEQVAPGLVKAGIVPTQPDEYHVTLVYAGDTSSYDAAQQRELQNGTAEVALQSQPFNALLGGVGRFTTNEGDGTNALYISIDSAYLPEFRQKLFDRLKFHLAIEQTHGFTAHITIGYLSAEQETPNIFLQMSSVQFDHLSFAWGNTVWRYPLGTAISAAKKSVNMYRKSMRDATRGLWSGALTLYDFHETMGSAIRRQFPLAWNEGAAKFGITDTERSDEEEQRLTLEINTEISYIAGFGLDIIDGSKANDGALQPLLNRAELWVNTYERIVSLAGTMAAADQKGEWFYGDTKDHCPSCSGYAERVYRNSTWRKYLEPYDLMPKGKGLACGGWLCDCSIKPTDKPITRGRPPIIQKMLHIHIHPEAPSA